MPEPKQALRQRAEKKAREAARPRKGPDALSPAEVRRLNHELQMHQIELEMQNEELRRVQSGLEATRSRYVDLYDFAPVAYFTISDEGLILEANLTAARLLGAERGRLIQQPLTRFILPADQDIYYRYRQAFPEALPAQACELRMLRTGAPPFWARLEASAAQTDGLTVFRFVASDISERKQAEEYQELGREVLQMLNESDDLKDCVQRLIGLLQARAGCEAVGIRLHDGDDYPYFAQKGFPEGFLKTENTLVERGADGEIGRAHV